MWTATDPVEVLFDGSCRREEYDVITVGINLAHGAFTGGEGVEDLLFALVG